MCGTSSNKFITLKIEKLERKFSSLWMKRVEDVNLNEHCIECLVGPRFEIEQKDGAISELPAPGVYYLCGVTYPYVWENNFHLAFEYREGEIFTIERKGLKVTVENAKEISITSDFIDKNLPQSTVEKFNTCRNWQFANYFEKKCKKVQRKLF